MKFHRIYALILRYMYLFRHSLDRQADIFFWPSMDLLLWGLSSTYFATQSTHGNTFVQMIASAIILWLIVWRGQYEVTVNLLEDLWNRNLINIFGSPLQFSEWVSGFVVLGIIKAIISAAFASLLAFVLYKTSIFVFGFKLIPFFILLIMTGWTIGFFVAGLIMRYGTKLQNLAWSMAALIAPFSGIYYPVSILPHWAQTFSKFIPTSYIFEGARQIVQNGNLREDYLYYSFALNILYLSLSLVYLKTGFNKRMERGLQKIGF